MYFMDTSQIRCVCHVRESVRPCHTSVIHQSSGFFPGFILHEFERVVVHIWILPLLSELKYDKFANIEVSIFNFFSSKFLKCIVYMCFIKKVFNVMV